MTARVARARRAALPLLVLAGALALSACGQLPARPAPSATTLPDGVTATLLRASPGQEANQVRLWVSNTTDDELQITRVRLSDPRFVGYGRLSQGGTIDVSASHQAEIVLTLPAIECDQDAAATASPDASVPSEPGATASPTPTPTPSPSTPVTTLIFGFTVGAATGVTAEPVSDPDGVMAAYLAAACA